MGVGPDCNRSAEYVLQLAQDGALLLFEGPSDVGIHPEENPLAVEIIPELLHFLEDFITDRRTRLDRPRSRAVRARLGELPLQTLFDPLSGDDDETEIGDLQRLRR